MSTARSSEYAENGYIIEKGMFSPEEMAEWKRRVTGRMKDEGWDKNPTGVSVWMAEQLDEFFRDALTGSRIAAVLGEVIGPDVEFLSVKPVYKSSKVSFGSPWHHDWAYWEGSHKVSVWIALDPATPTNGCLKMIPGSHKEMVAMAQSSDGIGFGNRIDESAVEGRTVVPLEAAIGDAVVFHDLTLHASFPNTDGQDRWSFIATYRDASEPDSSTVWSTTLPVPMG